MTQSERATSAVGRRPKNGYAKVIGEAPEGAYRVDVDVVNFDNNAGGSRWVPATRNGRSAEAYHPPMTQFQSLRRGQLGQAWE